MAVVKTCVHDVPPSQPSAEVLNEILGELDRERTKRAELENLLRSIEIGDDEIVVSKRHYIALQTELQGYRQLVEAMTGERPAVAEAVKTMTRQKNFHSNSNGKNPPHPASSSSTSLPLHVIRLLEVMPWDQRAREYAFATEELYQWEFYCSKQKRWLSEVRSAPDLLKRLPTTAEPKPGTNAIGNNNTKESFTSPFLPGGEFISNSPPSHCVLTDRSMTTKYNLQKGYPLPIAGHWEWIGGWRVEKRVSLNHEFSHKHLRASGKFAGADCDDHGWVYAMEADHFLLNPSETCWDHPGKGEKPNTVLRPFRRRKWTRLRALVDYPYSSESSKCFLRLMAQQMYATMTANKVSEQLVATKVALTNAESIQMQCKDEFTKRIHEISHAIRDAKNKNKLTSKERKFILETALVNVDQMQSDILGLMKSSFDDQVTSLPL